MIEFLPHLRPRYWVSLIIMAGSGCDGTEREGAIEVLPQTGCSESWEELARTCEGRCRDEGTGLCRLSDGSCVAEDRCADGWCALPALAFVPGEHDAPLNPYTTPVRPVILTRPYRMQQTVVTRAMWQQVMGRLPPTQYACGLDCPAAEVTYYAVLQYANTLGALKGLEPCYELTGCATPAHFETECERVRFVGPDCEGYRLPTEAEWEAAAGFGLGHCLPTRPALIPHTFDGFEIDCASADAVSMPIRTCGNAFARSPCHDFTWRAGVACGGPGPVHEHPHNRLGFYGLLGNVTEFTGTMWGFYPGDPPPEPLSCAVDPGHTEVPVDRPSLPAEVEPVILVKGGRFDLPLLYACSNGRNRLDTRYNPGHGLELTGFRLVQTLPAEHGAGR